MATDVPVMHPRLIDVAVPDLTTGDYTLELYGNGRALLPKPLTFSAAAVSLLARA